MDKTFIIYGAGKKGKWIYELLKWRKLEDRIDSFVDQKHEIIEPFCDKEIISLDKSILKDKKYLISLENEQIAKEIKEEIEKQGREAFLFNELYKLLDEEQHVFYREWCAFHHATQNDKWFTIAEEEEAVAVFWGDDSQFLKLFNELDLKNTIEIACGWGRHVPHYIDQTGQVTLVDILEENMTICKERFKDKKNIVYYKNNGFNLEKLDAEKYTSVFSYDSMVHFELFDVYEYLKDIYRILIPGGKALLHHSNYSKDYEANFAYSPHARCFMDKQVFAYMAKQIGFKVVKQQVIDWYGIKELDCISLLEKL